MRSWNVVGLGTGQAGGNHAPSSCVWSSGTTGIRAPPAGSVPFRSFELQGYHWYQRDIRLGLDCLGSRYDDVSEEDLVCAEGSTEASGECWWPWTCPVFLRVQIASV